ncbi:hypothetical protein GDO86_006535 [Hymenochirus boettgeri]|uniref:WD repeat-containing protein 76 n=1 Tax=Hymenochirus boettgeri TaxID=247094 RepID=A0A8T2JBH2_9PIPI|nr:hypothetical protein GDO86_006535 [Hymenochirus boettgeri]
MEAEGKKATFQAVEETTPKESRPSDGIALRTRRSQAARQQKRLLDRDDQDDGTPTKKVHILLGKSTPKIHPIVLLSKLPSKHSIKTRSTQNKSFDQSPEQKPAAVQLSEFELQRLKNIEENNKFLASLNLLKPAASLHSPPKKRNQARGIKRLKPQKGQMPVRFSSRLQQIDPSGSPLAKVPLQPEPMLEERPMKPLGPLEMIPINIEEKGKSFEGFIKAWESASKEKCRISQPHEDLKRYVANLQAMTLKEEAVAKVVQDRIFSVAIHPSETRTIVAAGDKWGQVGLWNMDDQSDDNGVCVFVPHSRPVCCMSFSPFNSAHLFSLSYDGTVRCGDVSCKVFDEVYRDENDSFSSFDFLSSDASVLLVSHWDSHLSVVDHRTPGTSCEYKASLGMKSARTVSIHPMHRDLCAIAGAGDVCVYDVRKLKKKRAEPVLSLRGHTKSVASAYFSPVTGRRILTTCSDDCIRVYDSSSMNSEVPIILSLRHNNNTGRWLTRFRAVWDPKQDNCFVIGSMARPRQIEVYHESGKLLHSFWDSEYLGSVCSINAFHPTRYLMVGGNSSGRLHVFQE